MYDVRSHLPMKCELRSAWSLDAAPFVSERGCESVAPALIGYGSQPPMLSGPLADRWK